LQATAQHELIPEEGNDLQSIKTSSNHHHMLAMGLVDEMFTERADNWPMHSVCWLSICKSFLSSAMATT